MLLAVTAKPFKVGVIVPPRAEGFLAVVAANDDVVEKAGGKQARTASHRRIF